MRFEWTADEREAAESNGGREGRGRGSRDSMVVELRKRDAWAGGGERPCAFINSMHDARKFQCSKSTLLGLTRQSKLSSTNIRTREETFSCAISYILYEKYFTFYLFIQNTPLIKILTTIPSSNSTQTRWASNSAPQFLINSIVL